MVTSIARQSVIIKCNLATSIMTGNYEFYYAAGLMYKLKGIAVKEVAEPFTLQEQIAPLVEDARTEDEREKHLAKMLRFYKPVETFDEQMKELFWMGNREQYMWQEHLPQL